ncbi:MAG: hypothetical protein FJX83_00040 [Bacteroidetes bacterium]|nr:hypothetical protein [Bacteroidota bacterium]
MQRLFTRFVDLFFSDRLYLSNVAATFGAQLLTALSVLILMPRLLLSLGEQQFATYGIVLNVIVFGGILDFGMSTGLLRRLIHERNHSAQLLSLVFTAYMLIFVVVAPVLFILHVSSTGPLNGFSLFQLVALSLLVLQYVLATLFDIVIQSTQRIFQAKIIRMFKVVGELIAILLILDKGSLDLVLICMIAFNSLYALVLYQRARLIVGKDAPIFSFDWKLLQGHLRYSFWYFLAALSTVLVFNSQLFVLDLMAGPQIVAQFVLFNRFFEIIRFAVSNFTVVLQPIIVDNEVNNPGRLKHLYTSALTRVGLLLLVVFIILNQWGFDLFMWWSKQRYPFDKSLYQLFLLYTTLILIDNVSALFLGSLKLNRVTTLVALVQGTLVVLAPVFFFEAYGLSGVVMASTAVLLLTNFIFNPIYLWKHIGR